MNINGLCSKRTDKLKSDFVKKLFDNNDCILFTETWTDAFFKFTCRWFEHYVLNREDIKSTAKRNSGGIIVNIRNNLVSDDSLVFTSKDDIIWV